MSLAWGTVPVPAIECNGPSSSGDEPGVTVSVIFTTVAATMEALREAGALADRLNARISLLVPQCVPYSLPITRPPVPLTFTKRRFRVITGDCKVEASVHILLCRDRMEALLKALTPHSLVVMGGRRRWLPSADDTVAKQLRCAGHDVIMVYKTRLF